MKFNRENYRDYDAINVSKLSQLDRNPSKVDEDKDWHDGMAFGSLVDLICFEPNKVGKQFHINSAEDPSSTAKQLADWILENKAPRINDQGHIVSSDGKPLNKMVSDARKGVGKNTNFKKYRGVPYLRSQIESENKNVISEGLHEKAQSAAMTLKTHEFTRTYFNDNRSHIEIQFQVPILWDPSAYDNELEWMAKSLLDIIILDHKNETVKPVDLKTTSSSVFRFNQKMTKWGYYLQSSYYYDGLRYLINNHDTIDDYDVLPFEFVVISSKNINKPLVYTCSENDLQVGREGGVLSFNDREVKGWIQLIKDLEWHEKTGKWDYSREVYENNGKVELDIFE